MNSGHNLKPRPWPVNPAAYPLSGPSRGPVYSPEPALQWWPMPILFVVGIAAMVAGFVYGLFR